MSVQTAVQQAAREAREVLGEIQATASFRVLHFGRHPDGYLHARVQANGGPIYVHCRWGSWMAPGTVNGKPVLKEVLSPYRDVLADQARQLRANERREEVARAAAAGVADTAGDDPALPAT